MNMDGYDNPISHGNKGLRARNPVIVMGTDGCEWGLEETLNQRVAGSNPARPTNKIKGLGFSDLTLFCAGGLPV